MAQQVNINLDDETAEVLDKMAREDAYDNRSAFVRRLIRMEFKRRQEDSTKINISPPPQSQTEAKTKYKYTESIK